MFKTYFCLFLFKSKLTVSFSPLFPPQDGARLRCRVRVSKLPPRRRRPSLTCFPAMTASCGLVETDWPGKERERRRGYHSLAGRHAVDRAVNFLRWRANVAGGYRWVCSGVEAQRGPEKLMFFPAGVLRSAAPIIRVTLWGENVTTDSVQNNRQLRVAALNGKNTHTVTDDSRHFRVY